MTQSPWHLGQTSEHYETGGRGSGSISHTPGDPGGPSYGLSQFALNTGSLQEYLDHSRYAKAFEGVEPGSPAFDTKWREVAKADPTGFSQDQHDFTKTQFYDVQNARLKADGLDLSQRGPAVQDALWSTSVQFRGITPNIFEKGLEEKFGQKFELSKLSDKDIVKAVQDYKIAHNDQLFHRSSAAVKASVLERAKEEKADLLNLADGKAVGRSQQNERGHVDSSMGQAGLGHITTLQANLAKLGYTDHRGNPLEADGILGPDTRQALERFQRDHHLTVDGKAGPLTQQALQSSLQHHATACDLTNPGHPDHILFEQALAGVRTLEAQQQHSIEKQRLNLAAALTVEAKREGLIRIDQVALGDNGDRAYITQHPKSSMEMAKFGSVDTASALQTPFALSSITAASLPAHSSIPPTVVQPHQPSQANTLTI